MGLIPGWGMIPQAALAWPKKKKKKSGTGMRMDHGRNILPFVITLIFLVNHIQIPL